jgi:hypothetical protein
MERPDAVRREGVIPHADPIVVQELLRAFPRKAGGRSADGSSPIGASCFSSIMIACSGESLVPSSTWVRPFS